MSDLTALDELAPRIYEVVKQVPAGQVATYGQVAQVVGAGCDARQVGAMLGLVKDAMVPWQRIINAKGTISPRNARDMALQRKLLVAEGIAFDERGRIDLVRFGWRGPDPQWAAQHGYQTLSQSDEPEQPSLL